jgi:DNA-binding XRE family transcriptional regulator
VFDDRLAWRCGLRLPLSAACRLTFAFGLTDPAQLHVDPLLRQLWASIEQNERHPSAAGWCPWCVADIVGGEPHMDTCLGNNLLHARSDPLPAATGSLPRPLKAGTRRTGSAPARGLKALRTSVGLTQVEMAAIAGVVANHYARMERCIVATTLTAADRIASHFAIDVAQVYASTEDAGDVGDNGENP